MATHFSFSSLILGTKREDRENLTTSLNFSGAHCPNKITAGAYPSHFLSSETNRIRMNLDQYRCLPLQVRPARSPTARTPPARSTGPASTASATARRAGRAPTATSSTSRCTSVCPRARTTGCTTWRRPSASVTATGRDRIARKVNENDRDVSLHAGMIFA